MISCQQQYFHKTQENEEDQISSKIDIINQLFKQMNLKKQSDNKNGSHIRNITSDSIETPIYEVPVKPQQLNKTQSEFQSYLKRKQQVQSSLKISEFNNQENENSNQDEDLLTDVRPLYEQDRLSQRKTSTKSRKTPLQQQQSNQTLKLSILQSSNQSKSLLRNKTENTIELISNRQQLCKNQSHRDMSKAQKNKQIIEQAYETYVEKKPPASKSPGLKQQQQINLIKNNFKHKINQLLSNTPEKKLRLQATIKKNYFIN